MCVCCCLTCYVKLLWRQIVDRMFENTVFDMVWYGAQLLVQVSLIVFDTLFCWDLKFTIEHYSIFCEEQRTKLHFLKPKKRRRKKFHVSNLQVWCVRIELLLVFVLMRGEADRERELSLLALSPLQPGSAATA